MATTIQSQHQQQQQPNPQLKRLVYSKYRELLGSYNDKANTIIQSLPSYMVTEDKGFNFKSVEDVKNEYGAPPPPPVPGSIPAQRLQTQIPAAAPACVQNAMMTKDKKPFTYTPGGIDLSEIKSPRMAKRIARNAQYEGVTGAPKPSPLAAQQNVPHQSPPAMGAAALGMPFQVFPTGPPPPPPIPSSSIPPPPPPQPIKSQLAPQSNGVEARKSPAPQNLEPPPMGCRPEIKIPENPMATLKKVPRPREKNDFWIQEYRKERSASPMVGESGHEPVAYQQPEYQQPEYQRPEVPLYQPQQYQSPVHTPQQVPSSPPFRPQEPEQPSMQQRSIPVQYQQPIQTQESAHQQRSISPIKTIQQHQQQQQQPAYTKTPSQGVTSPTPQQQQQQQQKNAQVGSLYIPPVAPENLAANQQQEQQQQPRQTPVSSPPTPRWMAQKPNSREMPEWVRDENTASPPTLQRTPSIQQSTPSSASPAGPGMQLKFQLNSPASNAKERVIPIQMEHTPTPTRTPATPGFGPQPFYNVNQQFSSVPSPGSGSGYSSPSSGFNTPSHPMRNPNQFVDQGYNNYPNQWPAQQQRVISPQQQSPQPSGTRIIPITIEGQESPFNPDVVRGPVSHTPMVIQNDPRTLQHQNSWSNGNIPNQSKSFKILQKITDTVENQDNNDGEHPPAQVHRQYSRPLSVSADSPTEQMRRMQLNDQDQAFMNRVKNQVDQEIFLHNEEDPRYKGPAIPSKSFKLLQNMIDNKDAGPKSDQVPMQRPQPPRYVQQRPVFQHEGQQQPYIHPSEQQVPEPKKYTGSAIPSRSFKILQAMTTPENAAEMEGSDVEYEYEQISPYGYYPPYHHPPHPHPYPYPYPYPPPYYHPSDPNMPHNMPNWHYPYPPPPPYYYYYPDYDSQMYNDYYNGYYPHQMPPGGDSEGYYQDQDTSMVETSISEDDRTHASVERNSVVCEDRIDETEDENEESVLEKLSKKLNEIIVKPDIDMNISKDDKEYVGDTNKDLLNSSSPPSVIDNNSDDDDSSTVSLSEKEVKIVKQKSRDGLQAIRSVTNISVYDTDEGEKEIDEMKEKKNHSTVADDDAETEDEDTINSYCSAKGKVEEDDGEEELECEPIESYDTDEGEELTEDEVVMQEVLSVIYEESEADIEALGRPDSRASTGSTLSDCSTTIANDDDSENDVDGIKDEEDNQNLVTVRLPLKLSFSKSSNDENITTVTVGDSQIEDEKSQSYKITPVEENNEDDTDNDDPDVSVSFSLSSKNNSGNFSKSGSIYHEASPNDNDNSDSEDVSVSISLPMKRDKFIKQTMSGDLTNDISSMASEYESCDSDGDVEKDDETLMGSDESTVKKVSNDSTNNKDGIDDIESTRKCSTVSNMSEDNSSESLSGSAYETDTNSKLKTENRTSEISNDDCKQDIEESDDESITEKSTRTISTKKLETEEASADNASTLSYKSKGWSANDDDEGGFDWNEDKDTSSAVVKMDQSEPQEEDVLVDNRKQSIISDNDSEIESESDFIATRKYSCDSKASDQSKQQRKSSTISCSDSSDDINKKNRKLSSISNITSNDDLDIDGLSSTFVWNYDDDDDEYDDQIVYQPTRKLSNVSSIADFDETTLCENEYDYSRKLSGISDNSRKSDKSLMQEYNEDTQHLEDVSEVQEKLYAADVDVSNEEEIADKIKVCEDKVEDEKEEDSNNFDWGNSEHEEKPKIKTSDDEHNWDWDSYPTASVHDDVEAECVKETDEDSEESDDESDEEIEDKNSCDTKKDIEEIVDIQKNIEEECSEEEDEDSEESEESESESSESDASEDVVEEPTTSTSINDKRHEKMKKLLESSFDLGDTVLPDDNEVKICIKDRISVFETKSKTPEPKTTSIPKVKEKLTTDVPAQKSKTLSRGSSQRSESEIEEDDSGVTDMSKPETDTESESFPELRKMTRYQRAATHSRLFKLLQDESGADEPTAEEIQHQKRAKTEEPSMMGVDKSDSGKKIVHNVSITRKTNPESLKDAETMSQRRERLSLPLTKENSIDADNLSSSNSPSSPRSSYVITDKLVNELVQSLLLKKKSRYLRNLPMEKLQAAAKRVLEEDMDSLENTSIDSTPALTPQEFKTEYPSSYADYYETWNSENHENQFGYDILPSKAFKNLQEQSVSGKRKPWAARCPRVLSSKTINRDLSRVPESPEMYRSASVAPGGRSSTPEKLPEFIRGVSLSR